MRNKILTLTENTLWELHKKKAFWVMFFIWFVGYVVPVYLEWKIFSSSGIQGAQLLSKASLTFVSFFQLVLGLGLLGSLVYASKLVQSEVSHQTISSVMVRPISRWEYLFGRSLGVVLFYFGFVLIAVLSIYLTFWITGVSVPSTFLWGVLQRLFKGVGLILVASSLGALMPSIYVLLLLGLMALLSIFLPSLPQDLYWWVSKFNYFIHYLVPVHWNMDFLQGVKEWKINKSFWLSFFILWENLLYGGVIFLGCAWVFSKKNLKLRE